MFKTSRKGRKKKCGSCGNLGRNCRKCPVLKGRNQSEYLHQQVHQQVKKEGYSTCSNATEVSNHINSFYLSIIIVLKNYSNAGFKHYY